MKDEFKVKALHKTVIIFIKKVKFKSFNFALFELFILLLYKAENGKIKAKNHRQIHNNTCIH